MKREFTNFFYKKKKIQNVLIKKNYKFKKQKYYKFSKKKKLQKFFIKKNLQKFFIKKNYKIFL